MYTNDHQNYYSEICFERLLIAVRGYQSWHGMKDDNKIIMCACVYHELIIVFYFHDLEGHANQCPKCAIPD